MFVTAVRDVMQNEQELQGELMERGQEEEGQT